MRLSPIFISCMNRLLSRSVPYSAQSKGSVWMQMSSGRSQRTRICPMLSLTRRRQSCYRPNAPSDIEYESKTVARNVRIAQPSAKFKRRLFARTLILRQGLGFGGRTLGMFWIPQTRRRTTLKHSGLLAGNLHLEYYDARTLQRLLGTSSADARIPSLRRMLDGRPEKPTTSTAICCRTNQHNPSYAKCLPFHESQ
jgi:hypothetical protein